MQGLKHCVPLKCSRHCGKFVFEVKVDELLFIRSFHFLLSHRVSPLDESPMHAVSLPSLRRPRDVVHRRFQLRHDDLILCHHVNRLQVAQLLSIFILNCCILLQLHFHHLFQLFCML